MITIYCDGMLGARKTWKWLVRLLKDGWKFNAAPQKARIKVSGMTNADAQRFFEFITDNAPEEVAYVEMG